MLNLLAIVKGDYLERTRSYAFLITLALTLYIAYAFIPDSDAAYSTVRVGYYKGVLNSAWVGGTAALMSSIFLFLIGFFLVNGSIKKDIDTELGLIIATTQISNFKYVLAKTLSNFLVLVTIALCTFIVSLLIFFLRSENQLFILSDFTLPYLLITIPSIFFTASVAALFEVVFKNRMVIQYVLFFFLFTSIVSQPDPKWLDPLGDKMYMAQMEEYVHNNIDAKATGSSVGFIFGQKEKIKTFTYQGVNWNFDFIILRLIWVGFSIIILFLASFYFHRFNLKEKIRNIKQIKIEKVENGLAEKHQIREIKLSNMTSGIVDFSIWPIFKAELLILLRRGSKFLWLINLGLMIAVIFSPLNISYQILLPVLWFVQVSRFSDIASKEKTSRMHYFTYASYRPLLRLFPSQIAAAFTLLVALSLPLLCVLFLEQNYSSIISVILGALFIVIVSALLGILSGSKKLFEILFFLLTYFNLNLIPELDYFGAFHNDLYYNYVLLIICSSLYVLSISLRSYELKRS